jgi:hypothetical protein
MTAAEGDAAEAFDDEVARCHVSCARDRWERMKNDVGDGLQQGCTCSDSTLDEAVGGRRHRMARQRRDEVDDVDGVGWDYERCHYWDGHFVDNR